MFKSGDKIVCINTVLTGQGYTDLGPLTKGETYTVRGVSTAGTINLAETPEVFWYREDRFEAVAPAVTKDEQIATLRKEIEYLRETENSQQKALISTRDQEITRLIEVKERLTREKDHEGQRYELRLTEASDKSDALVAHLHTFAEQQEDAGNDDVADEIDGILATYGLPTYKKTYELILTVPVQVRVSDIRATSPAKVREMFDAGEINWNVADHESQVDDEIKVVEIAEVPS